MLNEVQRELWDAYQRVEARALRADKLKALTTFLDCLAGSPEPEWFLWARSIAERVVDQGETLMIRMPLFERVLFPALLAGYRDALPGCARWLAGLCYYLYRSRGCQEQLPETERSELGLLRAALRHDPDDHRARGKLLEQMLCRLQFSLHELPSGVLYGMDGASPEQCQDLERELDEFRTLAAQERQEEHYAELISGCRFHFQTYREYLLSARDRRDYAQYLAEAARRKPNEPI